MRPTPTPDRAQERFAGEAVVKPVTLGSSIGVARCAGEEDRGRRSS